MASSATISIGFKIETGKDGFQKLIMDAVSLRRVMKASVKETEKLKAGIINFAAISSSLKGVQDSFTQIGEGLRNLISESGGFSSAMKATNTMAGKGAEDLELLKDKVSDLAKNVPVLREKLANGLYQVISNGVPEDNWISFLETSACSSVGGMADLGTAVTVTSTIIKNYGLEWDKAKEIQDKIQLTAKNGVTSFEQLAASLPSVTGNAATLSVGIDELMASFATLTGVSGNTSEVATQLGAIFSALVKPSSEAAKMAEAMGIQFDAAAIKAAGGFRSFIAQLKKDVTAYSQATGTLEQEVYGRLFGSAEAVRALIPLTGELAAKFSENVDAMKGSAGTMDAAFEEMASTGSAKTQLMKNKWAELTDFIASATSWMLPYVDVSSGVLSSASSMIVLTKAVKNLHLGSKLASIGFTGLTTAARLFGITSLKSAIMTWRMSGALDASAKTAIRLRIALRGLLVATGVGAAIWLLTEAVLALTGATDESADAILKEARAFDVKKRATDMATEAAETEAEARQRVSAQLSLDIARIKDFKGSKEEEKKIVGELNNTYGESMGYFSSVVSWYDALIKNSKAYCDQIVAEAKARKLADQVAELEIARDKVARDEKGNARRFSKEDRVHRYQLTSGNVTESDQKIWGAKDLGAVSGTSDWDAAVKEIGNYNSQIANLRRQMGATAKVASSIEMPVIGSKINPYLPDYTQDPEKRKGKKDSGSTPSERKAPEGSIAGYEERVAEIRKQIKYTTDPEEAYRLESERLKLQDKIKELEIPVRLAGSSEDIKEHLEDIDPIKIDVEVDTSGLEEGLQDIPKALTPSEKLQKNLGKVSDVAASAGEAFKGMGQAFEMPALDIMGMLAGAIVTMIQGYATATAKSSSLGPWGWAAFGLVGLAQLTAMITQVKSIAKFADGGVVSGPTMALVGEYAGASNNPEVIAPLDKLQSIIGATGGAPVVIDHEIKIKGRDLVILLRNENAISGKTGRKGL